MKFPFPKPAQRGFSLIEVLIAVVILSLGLLALASLQSALIRSASDAKAQSLAMAIAKQKIEQLAAYQTLGGTDNGCVSPATWVAGQTSCYRAITDRANDAVDGNPSTTAVDPMGGIVFTTTTAVTRYVYNVSTDGYQDLIANAKVTDTALDSAMLTSPDALLPGKEFKRILVTVAWTDATAANRTVQVEDALNGIVPRDSIAIVNNRKGMTARTAESIITNPGSVAGVIPIAVGNGSNTAASNPTPELLGGNNSTYVSETRFDVYTYIPLNSTTALAQARVETAVVGCRCDTATASTVEKPLRPTYWNGVRYAIPTQANYIGLTGSATAANRGLAGPKALSGSELAQSDQCRVCCRDHYDPAGNDANGDPRSVIAKFSPRRTTHSHFLVDSTGARTAADTGVYSEVCRMIRVDGIFRVAADLQNDYFALLPARNDGVSSFVPTTDVGDDYGAMVKNYIDARITSQNDNTRYNESRNAPTPAGPDPASYESGTRTLSDNVTTRAYDLNLPASYYLKLTADSKWLHARGLYIDYLTPEAIAQIDAAKAGCATQPATNDCVLPYLPFTSINLSELAEWKDIPINPAGAASGQVISVQNNLFKTASADVTYTVSGASGNSGETTISFAAAISSSIVPGMAVSGTGVSGGARVTSVANNSRSVTVDKANTASVGASIVFQGVPVRGLAIPGGAPVTGNTSYARSTASYNNAAIALKFPMNAEEGVLVDNQRIEISADGLPPDPTAGAFTVTGFVSSAVTPVLYPFGTPYPVVEWGIGASGSYSINACNRLGAPLPYQCEPTSGLGGPMRVRLSGYNVKVTPSEAFTGSCKKPSGSFVTVSGTTTRPYCKNYDVWSASAQDSLNLLPAVPATTPYTVNNPGKSGETTELYFSLLNKTDVITIGIEANGQTAGTFVSCTATGGGNLDTVVWTDPCL